MRSASSELLTTSLKGHEMSRGSYHVHIFWNQSCITCRRSGGECGSIHVYYRQAKMNFHFQNLQGIPTSFVSKFERSENQKLKSIEKFTYWLISFSLNYSSITFHTFDTKMQFWFLVKSFVFFQIISDCFYIMYWHSLKEIEIIEKDSKRNKVTFSRITSKTCWHTLYSVELFIPRCFGFSTFIFVAFSAFCLLPLWKSRGSAFGQSSLCVCSSHQSVASKVVKSAVWL